MLIVSLALALVGAPAREVPDGASVGKPFETITALALSPDGRRVAIAEGKAVVVLNVASGKELSRYTKHTDTIRALAFHPDGKRLVSASLDKCVRIQDVTRPKDDP